MEFIKNVFTKLENNKFHINNFNSYGFVTYEKNGEN